jgi:uncharacterized protein YlxW (UPF0749 family)
MAAESPRRSRTPSELPQHVTMGLLDNVTATSLDEGYAIASRRRAETGETTRGKPGRAGLVILLVFGVLVATAAVETARTADESANSRSSLVKQADEHKAALDHRLAEVRTLQKQVSALQAKELRSSRQGRSLDQRLDQLGVMSGARPATGPGIRIVVDDAPDAKSFKQQVQAPDLQKLVNGLWQVGAEAIAINGQRLTSLSSIRDAGSAITVNYVSLRHPYTVSAIGDPKTMGARVLDTAGGQALLTLQSTFGLQFDVNTKDSMLLPAAKRVTLREAHEEPAPTPRRPVPSGGAG